MVPLNETVYDAMNGILHGIFTTAAGDHRLTKDTGTANHFFFSSTTGHFDMIKSITHWNSPLLTLTPYHSKVKGTLTC